MRGMRPRAKRYALADRGRCARGRMAILTPLQLDDARRIGARYGLEIAGVRGIPAGSVNSNCELSLAGGARAFLRVYEEQTAITAEGEARMLDHLSAQGV